MYLQGYLISKINYMLTGFILLIVKLYEALLKGTVGRRIGIYTSIHITSNFTVIKCQFFSLYFSSCTFFTYY